LDEDIHVLELTHYRQPGVQPFIYTALFLNPKGCRPQQTDYRDKMPKENTRLTPADVYSGWTCDGLYFQHRLIGGRLVVAALVIVSLVIANVWGVMKDVGAGYAIGQYILAVVSLLAIFMVNR